MIKISVFEYDRRVSETVIDTETVAQYFLKNPERKEAKLREHDVLEEEIVLSNIRKDLKEKYLNEINESRKRLQSFSPNTENQHNPYALIGLGIVIGIMIKTGFDYAYKKFIEIKERAYQRGQQRGLEEYLSA